MSYIATPVVSVTRKLLYAFVFFFLFVFWAADGVAQSSVANFIEKHDNGVNGVVGLLGISDVDVSPDGRFVYTASYSSSSVSVFERNLSTGKLTYSSTVTGATAAFSLVVSPDNKSVYVASPVQGKVFSYNRDQATGALTLINLAEGNSTSGFVSVSISKDGKWVYGVGGQPSGVAVFSRDMDTGALTLVQDLSDNSNGYELGQQFSPTTSPIKNIATSTDGQYIYITSTADHAVTVFAVNKITGQLTQLQVVKDGEGGIDAIQAASSLILSPNGRFLYVSGQGENSIAIFSVNQYNGTIAYIGKVTNGVDGVTHLVGARSLAMSPDGRYLFASAITSNAVSSFMSDPATGLLTLVSVASQNVDGVTGLSGSSGLVTDSYSRHLYVAGQSSSSLVVFSLPVPAVELTVNERIVPYNGEATQMDPLLEVYDADSENLASAMIVIDEGLVDTDQLLIELQGGISGTYDKATGTLSLTGIASLTQYRDVLRTLRFKSGVDENILPGSYATRIVSIIVSDGTNISGAARIAVRIERSLNTAPVISGTPITTVDRNSAYSFIPTATDSDGDVLVYKIVNKPDWANFDTVTGELSGTPGDGDVGITTGITISVGDGTLTVSLPSFDLQVIKVNHVPTITGSPASTIRPGEMYRFEPSAADLDGDQLTFSILNKPNWATFDLTTGILTGTPLRKDEGLINGIVISVNDGSVSVALPQFNIEVEPASAIAGITFENASFVYDGTTKSLAIKGTLPTGVTVSYDNNARTDAGTQTVTASIHGGDYYSDLSLTADLTIGKADLPNITFTGDSFVYDGTTKSLAIKGTLPTGVTVSYDNNARTYAGSQTVRANINGGANYNNLSLTAELTIAKASQKINFQEVGTVARNQGRIPLNVNASSGLPIVLKSDDSFVATVEGNDLLIHRLGTVRITATQLGDMNHEAAETVGILVRVEDELEGPVKVSKPVSPNGDGINDFLILEGVKDFPNNRLQIFSRNGVLLFDLEGYDNGDKVFKGQSNTRSSSGLLPDGTYFYVFKYKNGSSWNTKKGWFVLKMRY